MNHTNQCPITLITSYTISKINFFNRRLINECRCDESPKDRDEFNTDEGGKKCMYYITDKTKATEVGIRHNHTESLSDHENLE